jgi:hypothetical protein
VLRVKVRWGPGPVVSEHCVEDYEQLSGTGHKGEFFGLPGTEKALIELGKGGVVSDGGESGHVQDGPNRCTTTPDVTSAAKGAAVHVEGCEPGEGCCLFTAKLSELREFGKQGEAGDTPDAGGALNELVLGTPDGALANGVAQVRIDALELVLKPRDMSLDLLFDVGVGRLAQPIALGRDHVDNLPATGDMRFKASERGIRDWTRLGANAITEKGKDLGINGVCFGQSAQSPGEIANLAWIDDGDAEADAGQRGRDSELEAASCFEDYRRLREGVELPEERFDPVVVVGDREPRSRRMDVRIEGGFRDVNSDDRLIHAVPPLLSWPSLADAASWPRNRSGSGQRNATRRPC